MKSDYRNMPSKYAHNRSIYFLSLSGTVVFLLDQSLLLGVADSEMRFRCTICTFVPFSSEEFVLTCTMNNRLQSVNNNLADRKSVV